MTRQTFGTTSVLAASILWGTTGTVAALAPTIGSIAVGAAAMGVGGLLQALVALPTLRAYDRDLVMRWRTLLLSGIAVGAYPLAFYTSMRLAGVAVGTVVSIGSAPLAAALVERVVDRTAVPPRWVVGGGAGLLGLTVLTVAEAIRSRPRTTGFGGHPLPGIALGLLAGITYALYSWGAAHIMRNGVPPRPTMGAIFGVGSLLLMPVLLVTGSPIVASWRNASAVAYLALIPMFVGYTLFGRGLSAISASAATTLSLLEPAVAALLALVVLHERLSPLGWAGVVILMAGLLVVSLRPEPAPRLANGDLLARSRVSG